MKNPEMGSEEPEDISQEEFSDKKEKDNKISRRGFLKAVIGTVAGSAVVAGGLELAKNKKGNTEIKKSPEIKSDKEFDLFKNFGINKIEGNKNGEIEWFDVNGDANINETKRFIEDAGYEIEKNNNYYKDGKIDRITIFVKPKKPDFDAFGRAYEKWMNIRKNTKPIDSDKEFIDGLLKKYEDKK